MLEIGYLRMPRLAVVSLPQGMQKYKKKPEMRVLSLFSFPKHKDVRGKKKKISKSQKHLLTL